MKSVACFTSSRVMQGGGAYGGVGASLIGSSSEVFNDGNISGDTYGISFSSITLPSGRRVMRPFWFCDHSTSPTGLSKRPR